MVWLDLVSCYGLLQYLSIQEALGSWIPQGFTRIVMDYFAEFMMRFSVTAIMTIWKAAQTGLLWDAAWDLKAARSEQGHTAQAIHQAWQKLMVNIETGGTKKGEAE